MVLIMPMGLVALMPALASSPSPTAGETSTSNAEIILTQPLATIVVGILALIAASISLKGVYDTIGENRRQFAATISRLERDHTMEEERLWHFGRHDRFLKAGDQLSSENPYGRIAGIHALGILGSEWREHGKNADEESCRKLLEAYIRQSQKDKTEDAVRTEAINVLSSFLPTREST